MRPCLPADRLPKRGPSLRRAFKLTDVRWLELVRLSRKLAADAKSLPIDDLWLVTHEALRRVPRVTAAWDFIVGTFASG